MYEMYSTFYELSNGEISFQKFLPVQKLQPSKDCNITENYTPEVEKGKYET